MAASRAEAADVEIPQVLEDISAVRAMEGLSTPTPSPDQSFADALALRATGQAESLSRAAAAVDLGHGSGPGYTCFVCAPATRAGDGTFRIELIGRADWDVPALLTTSDASVAALLDPRLVGLSAALSPDGVLALVARVDPSRAFTRPVVWPRRIQAQDAPRLRILVPPGAGARLTLSGPGGVLTSGRDFGLRRLDQGTGLLEISLEPAGSPVPLALGVRYRVSAGPLDAGALQVKGMPAGRVRFTRLSARQRRMVLSAIRRAPAPVRMVWMRVGARLEVTRGTGTCPPLTSCTDVTPSGFRISLSPGHLAQSEDLVAFTITHELGHVADLAGITESTRSRIRLRMRSQGQWRCVIDPSRIDLDVAQRDWCLSDSEQWADDFARYATGDPTNSGAYGPRALLGAGSVARILRTGWALRSGGGLSSAWTGPGRPHAG